MSTAIEPFSREALNRMRVNDALPVEVQVLQLVSIIQTLDTWLATNLKADDLNLVRQANLDAHRRLARLETANGL